MSAKKDLTGLKINKLTVLREIPYAERKNKKKVEWECKCDCGKITRVPTSNLTNNHTKSCGCWRGENASKLFSLDLTQQSFGKLTAISPTEQRGADGSIIWKCKCDCGNIHYASTNSLRTGSISSCGCQRSRGEQKINNLLFEHKVSYRTQFWFSDLKDQKYLYFDFAVFNSDNTLKCLIEYQGIQHYDTSVIHGAWQNLPQKHDEMKREYCQKHNIKLVEIPYTDYNDISWEYLCARLEL